MMEQFKRIVTFSLILLFGAILDISAQQAQAETIFKNHINGVVQKVKKTDDPQAKRRLLNTSFNKLLKTLHKVESKTLSPQEKQALVAFQQNITDKKSELNGVAGFERVPDDQLNNFADFVQQDFEQADIKWWVVILYLALLLGPVILLT